MVDEFITTQYGQMSLRLHSAKLRDLCIKPDGIQTGPFGSQLHQSDYVPVGTPIITVEHLGDNRIIKQNLPLISDEDKERLARYVLRIGDIVFSRVGSVDRRALVREEEKEWLFSGRCLRVRSDPKLIDSAYLSWFFGMPSFQEHVRKIAVGATMPSLNTSLLGDLNIYYPDLPEQRAIVHILGTLDDKIELNRRMNETLEAMAQALFKSWFADFDPVRAKAEGRDPGLPKEIADFFPAMFQESALGKIPVGWEVDCFINTIDVIGGGTPKTSVQEYWNGDIPWFSVVDAPIKSDVFVIDTGKKITQAGLENSATRLLTEGTTIITARGTVGKIALVGVPMAMNQSCYGIKGRIDEKGYYTYYTTQTLIGVLQQCAHGSVFNTITRDTFATVQIIVPPHNTIKLFENIISSFLERIKNNLFELGALISIRNAILPKLLSGELSVKKFTK